MPKVSDIYTELQLDLTPFNQGIKQATSLASGLGSQLNKTFSGKNIGNSIRNAHNQMKSFINETQSGMKSVGRIVQGILISQAFYTLTREIKEATKEVFNFKAATEEANISFKYLLGTGKYTKPFLRQLEDFAAVTPFNLTNIRDFARQLLSAGFSANQVLPVLQKLTDTMAVAGGDPEVLERVVGALAKMKAQGRATARQINSIALAGIPVYKILQEELGLSSKQLSEIGKQAISADTVINAILNGLQKRYKGAANELSKTTRGLMSTIKDNATLILADVFDEPYQKFKGFIENVAETLGRARELIRTGGLGAVIEGMIPPELQEKIKFLIVDIKLVGQILRDVGTIILAGLQPLLYVIQALSPLLQLLANAIHFVAEAARNGSAWLRILISALSGLFIAGVIAKFPILLAKAISKLFICQAVAKAVTILGKAIKGLYLAMTAHPIVAIISIIAGALLTLVLSSDKASAAFDNLSKRIAKFFGLDLDDQFDTDIDTGNIDAEMEDMNKYFEDMDTSAGNAGGAVDDFGKDATNAGKKAKKAGKDLQDFLFPFDEVYRIPEEHKSLADDMDDLAKGIGDVGKGLGDMGIPTPKIGDVKKKTKKTANDVGRSLRDQLEHQPPILLPGFKWPEFNFEPVKAFAKEVIEILGLMALSPGLLLWKKLFDLSPALKEAMKKLKNWGANSLSPWLKEQTEKMKEWVGNVGRVLGGARWIPELGGVLGGLGDVLGLWGSGALGRIKDWIGNVGKSLGNSKWAPALEPVLAAMSGMLGPWCKANLGTITEWIANVDTALRTNGWRAALEAGLEGTGEPLTQWSSDTTETVNQWVSANGKSVQDWATEAGINIGNWSTEASGATSQFANSSDASIKTWNQTTGQKIHSWARDTGQSIKDWATDSGEKLKTWSGSRVNTLQEWGKNVKTSLDNTEAEMDPFGKTMNEKANQYLSPNNGMRNALNSWNSSTGDITKKSGNAKKGVITTIGTLLLELLKLFKGAKPALGSAAASYYSPMDTESEDAVDDAVRNFGAAPGRFRGLKWKFKSGVSAMLSGAKQALTGFGSFFNKTASHFSLPTFNFGFPGFYGGGMISRNQLIEVGERNKRETVVPLENRRALSPIYNHIDDSVDSAISRRLGTQAVQTPQASTQLRPLYVGTLVADERSLRQLERKMKIIEVQEELRKGVE